MNFVSSATICWLWRRCFKTLSCVLYRWHITCNIRQIRRSFIRILKVVVENLTRFCSSVCSTYWSDGWSDQSSRSGTLRKQRPCTSVILDAITSMQMVGDTLFRWHCSFTFHLPHPSIVSIQLKDTEIFIETFSTSEASVQWHYINVIIIIVIIILKIS